MINIRSGCESDSDSNGEVEHAEKLCLVKAILEEVPFAQLNLTSFRRHYSGIYRKFYKPLQILQTVISFIAFY